MGICALLTFNILLYTKFNPFQAETTQNIPNNEQIKVFKNFPGHTTMRIAPRPPEIEYTQEELDEAIIELNLPTWSRSYVPCTSNESEVTCSQIVKAWRTIKQWENHVNTTSLEDDRYVLTKHYFDGVGNRISIDIIVFLLALMGNRRMVVEGSCMKGGQAVQGCGNAYYYQRSILLQNKTTELILADASRNPPYYVQTFDGWWWAEFNGPFKSRVTLDLSYLMYATQMYTHFQMYDYAKDKFGMHAIYFISNFLCRIPQKNIDQAKKIIENIPKGTRIFGVHLRFQFPGQFYSYSVETTMKVVKPFLWQKIREQPTVIAFASDSKAMEEEFLKEFGKYSVKSNATRMADFDHVSALTDIALLMMCDECLLSYRSTFSFAIASRMGKRCWFYEKEALGIFQASNSQATAVSLLFHNWDVNDWQTNRRFKHASHNEEGMRYFYKYFML
ncbi:hypothetical protein TVAG_380180 [Trichomonas vaginalis G3]|uniref:Uncharacterized protein n=1 Tax=Trichomonas vaginalis (strain ATCC PRA-98 / G3) TaxID=412133 RepID=A2DXF6_TRIV3|nr:hypothetical protein TVAGG3_0925320 [Trichomonas vaginalis G3]EAY14908.1 hypothetical protein TVAG_380180 [Trichomonas vaginalis G3]KAI5485424.1 hypothetical protein TVAGG3_0925320 [Trichomonas vaginalis G3]|eukprot:XP_001327131.1 hypothetical protein [Trichomonas vaginalis G3]